MNIKRKLKELEYQNPWNILRNYRAWKKRGAKIGATGSGIIVNVTSLGLEFGHECYITGETFNKYVQPAITKALEETLVQQRTYLKILDSQIEKETENEVLLQGK